jgi:ubiquinone/menaquinone biosynthesis C-methylase UbiE
MNSGLELERSAAGPLPVMQAHALWADTYDDGTNPLLALEERGMEALLPELKDKYVLDVACGTGRWLERLRPRGARHVFGVDLSREMLQVASTKPALAGALVRADCLALPFRGDSTHLSICSFAVSYISELPAFANELARISRTGAHVFISDLHPEGHSRGWKRSFHWGGRAIQIASFAYSIQNICEVFEKSGFVLAREVEFAFDEPERPIFARAGKLSTFDSIRGLPAVFILEFQFTGKRGNPSIKR